MKSHQFIAKRITGSRENKFSAPVIKIAVLSVALSICVMIVALAILRGFKEQIREKMVGFGSDIQIVKYNNNNSIEYEGISKSQDFYKNLKKTSGIKHIQVFGIKPGIIKTQDQIQGFVLKGVDNDFDWNYFKDKLIAGKIFSLKDSATSDSVIISKSLAKLLKLNVGDALRTYYIIDNAARARKFYISGIYNTGLADFDLKYVFGDIKHIQKLNSWGRDTISGFEVFINDFKNIDAMGHYVYEACGANLNARTIKEMYPQMFDWLNLQNTNVAIIITILLLISVMAIVSTLLVLILERTNMIGILKSLGMKNTDIRKVFLYNAAYIVGKGLSWGNIVGLSLCFIQKYTGLLKLPQESYFMDTVPIAINLWHVLLLNIGAFAVCTSMLIFPTFLITKISPVKAIKFD